MSELNDIPSVGDITLAVEGAESSTTAAMISEDSSVDGNAALERFLQQQRSDLMYELRRIRFGNRPVTGQDNRQNIENFIAKHMQEPAGASHGKENVPSNVDTVDMHRPEAVVVEVQGVFEQRRVSSILQTSTFRRHLENIIRGSIASAQQTLASGSHRVQASVAAQTATSAPLTPAVAGAGVAGAGVAGVAGAGGGAITAGGLEGRSVSSSSTDGSDILTSDGIHGGASMQQRASFLRPSLQQTGHQMVPAESEQGEQQMWNNISQIQHEDMVYEISELLHRRLVSSALSSEFRTVMELQIQNHQRQTGADGEAVASFIRNLPQSQNHLPNDFSQMGIMPELVDDNSDNLSITGISATAVPYTQTNMHLSREIQSLKSQMAEMKNMLRLSFDLQMDIQRAIRQEVAAALSAITNQGASASTEVQARRSVPVNDTYCLICMDNHSDCVLYQCGHMCVCFLCGKSLLTRGNAKCPVCRAAIRDVIRAYKTNTE